MHNESATDALAYQEYVASSSHKQTSSKRDFGAHGVSCTRTTLLSNAVCVDKEIVILKDREVVVESCLYFRTKRSPRQSACSFETRTLKQMLAAKIAVIGGENMGLRQPWHAAMCKQTSTHSLSVRCKNPC
eukprot:6193540-Pleurochrysis_carterae.AAC.3